MVHFCDFMDFFRDLSAAIQNDDYFQSVTLNAWAIPAYDNEGQGAGRKSGNTDGRRAIVTHSDGVQEARNKSNRVVDCFYKKGNLLRVYSSCLLGCILEHICHRYRFHVGVCSRMLTAIHDRFT